MIRQHGFTLIELIMVIILIGIIAAYAAPRFNRDAYDARAASVEIIEAIRYAQTMAMQHSGLAADADADPDFYYFQIAGNTYTVAIGDSSTPTISTVANPMTGAAAYAQSWAAGKVTLAVTGAASIHFNSRGEPVSSTGSSLAANTTINVTTGSETNTVTVEQLTGFTR
jgi:MSHA pilin protein MshC